MRRCTGRSRWPDFVAALATGAAAPWGAGLQYADVRDAWNYYLQHDNKGRGVVLVGHSQGSFILIELMRQEIDGKPIQSRIVSAILLGTTVAVPKGKDVGGTFKNIPLCHSATQTGCLMVVRVIPIDRASAGQHAVRQGAEPDMVAACTNPAALAGGSGAAARVSLDDGRRSSATRQPKPWATPAQPIDTPYVSVPGLLSAEVRDERERDVSRRSRSTAIPADPRVDDISGDLMAGTQVQANWGLHLIDVNLGIGNFLDIVGQEAKAYLAKAKK